MSYRVQIVLFSMLTLLASPAANALEIKTFTEGPVTLKATANKYFIEGGTFSTLGHVSEAVASGKLPKDLVYTVNVQPRSPETPKEDGTGESHPANLFTAYCFHAGSLERKEVINFVPFANAIVGAPIRIFSTYDLQLVATKDGAVVFDRTYIVRADEEARASRFKQPCADQGVAIGTLYQKTFTEAFGKVLIDMKAQ